MQTKLIHFPDAAALTEAAGIIRAGGLVAFPTETVYGLGGNALREDAASKIYAAKGRPSDNPLIVHLADASQASRYAYTTPLFERLAAAFTPGPITMILPKRPIIPDTVTGGLSTVAIRIPRNETAREFIRACGLPIAAPSANLSGRPSPTNARDVFEDMNGKIEMILDGGDAEIGLESTIVSLVNDELTLLRPGAVTPGMLRTLCPELRFDDCSMRKLTDGEKPMAPGMKYRHYAPRAQVILLDGERELILSFLKEAAADSSVGVITDGTDMEAIAEPERRFSLGRRENPAELAAHLFSALREIDRHPSIKTVYAAMPEKDGIGLAVYNRMMKASGFTVKKLS